VKLRQSSSYLKHQREATETTGHSTEDISHERTFQSRGPRLCWAGGGWNGTKFNHNSQLLKRGSWSQLQPCSSAGVQALGCSLCPGHSARLGSRRGKTGGFCDIPAAVLIVSNIHGPNGCRELPQAASPAGRTPDSQQHIGTGCERSLGGT